MNKTHNLNLLLIFTAIIIGVILLASAAVFSVAATECPLGDESFCQYLWPILLTEQYENAICVPPPFATTLPDYDYDDWCGRDFLTPTADPDVMTPVIGEPAYYATPTQEAAPYPTMNNPLYQSNPFRFQNPFGLGNG